MDSPTELTVTTNFLQDILAEDDPGWKYSEYLFRDFREIMEQNGTALSSIESFQILAGEQAEIMRQILERISEKQSTIRTKEIRQEMMKEKELWRLFAMMIKDEATEPERIGPIDQHSSHRQIHQFLFNNNAAYRKLHLVKDWCEINAADLSTDLYFGESKSFLWELSLHNLKTGSKKNGLESMMLDASILAGGKFSGTDQEDERQLFKHVLQYLRCGQLQEKTISPTERGIYGFLSGNLEGLRGICSNWEDELWAHASCAVQYILAEEIAAVRGQEIVGDASANFTLEQILFQIFPSSSNQRVQVECRDGIRSLAGQLLTKNGGEVMDWIQDWLSSSQIPPDQAPPRHLLRIFLHIILILRLTITDQLRSSFPVDDILNSVLELFVGQLIEDDRREEVAFYSSLLTHPILQANNFAVIMEKVLRSEDRLTLLQLAEKNELNLGDLCVAVVRRMRQTYATTRATTTTAGSTSANQSQILLNHPMSTAEMLSVQPLNTVPFASLSMQPEDRKLVRSLEWLLFQDSTRLEALHQSNAIIRQFLLEGKGQAAWDAIEMLPSDTYDVIKGMEEVGSCRHANALRQHFSFKAYLEAEDSFGEWFQHFRKRPKQSTETAEFGRGGKVDLVQEVIDEEKKEQHEEMISSWNIRHELFYNKAVESLNKVNRFPDPVGWLINGKPEDGSSLIDTEEDYIEEEELRRLRESLLPRTFHMLFHIYTATDRPDYAARLAVSIANQSKQFHTVIPDALDKLAARKASILEAYSS